MLGSGAIAPKATLSGFYKKLSQLVLFQSRPLQVERILFLHSLWPISEEFPILFLP